MLSYEGKEIVDRLVGSDEKQEILEGIYRANAIRRESSLPRYDVRVEYVKRVIERARDNYRRLVDPLFREYMEKFKETGTKYEAYTKAMRAAKETLRYRGIYPPASGGFKLGRGDKNGE